MAGGSGAGRLRHERGFRRFWAASTVSDLGTFAGGIAISLTVVDVLGGSAADVGLVQAASTAPYLVLGLFAGVLVDRVRRKPLLVGTDLGQTLVLAAVPLMAVTGTLTVGRLAGLMLAFGVLAVLNAAAHQSFLPRLVRPEQLPRANARLEQSRAVAQTTGPVVGGGLVAAIGAPLTVLVDAVSYAVSGLLLAATPVADPRPVPTRRRVLADLAEGLRWVYRHPALRPLAVTTHVWFLFHAVLMATYVPFARGELGLDPLALGVTSALAGVGALLGSSASEALGRRVGLAATVGGARVLEACGFAVVAAAAVLDGPAVVAVAAAGQLVYGFGLGAEGPIELSYRQAVTPDRLQGRMNATMRSLNRAAVVVGAPLGGLFADAVGMRPALWLGSAGVAATGAVLVVSGFRRATPHDRAPAPS